MPSEFFASKPKENEPWDTIILGSGPAGLTAAIYTTRGAASTLIVAGDTWGGQLMLTTQVDNFPGFPNGIQGPELMQAMRQQAERFGAEIIERNVTAVDFKKSPFEIVVDGKTYKTKSVIVATGADTKWLGVPGEERLRGRGVSSCAPCDAPFFKDKKVIVVGGGDSAMEEALVLAKYASEVTIVHRKDSFRASSAMQSRVTSNPKIKTLFNSEIKEFLGENKLEKVHLFTKEKGDWEMDIDGVFVAIGHTPATAAFKNILEMNELGNLIRTEKDGFHCATNVSGVFTAGDVHDNHYKQAITAAGFGAQAALDVLTFLDKNVQAW